MTGASTAFTPEEFAAPYPPGIQNHYWYRARNRILGRKLRPIVGPGARVLDLGCGPGIAVDYLRRLGIDCLGVDLGSPRPVTETVAPFLSLGISTFDLPAAARDSFTILLLMDVLEHLPEPARFLCDCQRHFPNATHLFVTLPARMEIWSSYDEHYRHYRRFTLESLSELVDESDLHVLESGYFFHALYAAARIAAFGSRKRDPRFSTPRPMFAHAALGWGLALEEEIVPARVPGSSLYALLDRRHAAVGRTPRAPGGAGP